MWSEREKRELEMGLQVSWGRDSRFWWAPSGVGSLAWWLWAGPGDFKQRTVSHSSSNCLPAHRSAACTYGPFLTPFADAQPPAHGRAYRGPRPDSQLAAWWGGQETSAQLPLRSSQITGQYLPRFILHNCTAATGLLLSTISGWFWSHTPCHKGMEKR